jgi:hypothetical protein
MQISQLPAIGAPLDGGFYAGLIRILDETFAIIVAPKATGERERSPWGEHGKKIEGASSVFDGRSNTIAMAEAGCELAQWALTLQIGAAADWYLPSRDELEIIYRNLKPTAEENYTWRHGENVSAVPPTYAYTEEVPAQTSVAPFQDDGAEAFADTWYWSSSQYSATNAWFQNFDDGYQHYDGERNELRARAVRRLLVIQ